MNSFDLFRTLVHARNGKPGEDSVENHYPIAENVAKVQPGDLIVSDYEPHRADKAIEIVKRICGLDNRVIVTMDGKYQGWVWDTLPARPLFHLGDHQRSDVDSPTEHRICGVLCSQHQYSESEEFLRSHGFPVLASVCREARLRTWTERYRGIELLQADYNFPALFLASIVLNRRYPTETLLMSSRDCWLWVQLLQKLYGRGIYWYTSCRARLNADENYHRYIRSLGPNPLLVDLCGSGKSFAEGLPQYPCFLLYRPNRGAESVPAIVTSQDCWRLEQANVAPQEKCAGVDANLRPIFINQSGTDFQTEPNTRAQCHAFEACLRTMNHYDLSAEIEAEDQRCVPVIDWLIHKYVNFKAAVEELRLLAIRDDA